MVLQRMKKNRLVMEKKHLRDSYDSELLKSKVEVQEATFETLGHELHDNIGQLLSTSKLLIGITERNLTNPPESLLSAGEALDKAIREIRSLSRSLNSEWLQQFNIYQNLEMIMEGINSSGKLKMNLVKGAPLLLPSEQQFILFRLLQEAIQNIVKHAKATSVIITLQENKNILTVTVEDNGIGFDPRTRRAGLGIGNMRQRAKTLVASINWYPSPLGTKIIIQLPLIKKT
jgi:signal transduction histidine kinase